MDLTFAREALAALEAYFASQEAPSKSEWHVTHNLFFPTEAARSAVEKTLAGFGLFTSYRDTTDDDLRPFWLDMMEPVPPNRTDVEARLRRVLEVLEGHDGEYNSFTLIGSRGEAFPE